MKCIIGLYFLMHCKVLVHLCIVYIYIPLFPRLAKLYLVEIEIASVSNNSSSIN